MTYRSGRDALAPDPSARPPDANPPDRLERRRIRARGDVRARSGSALVTLLQRHSALPGLAPRPADRSDPQGWLPTTHHARRGLSAPPPAPPGIRLRRADAPVHLLRLRCAVHRHDHRPDRGRYRPTLLWGQLLPRQLLRGLQAGHQSVRPALYRRPAHGALAPLRSGSPEVQS